MIVIEITDFNFRK